MLENYKHYVALMVIQCSIVLRANKKFCHISEDLQGAMAHRPTSPPGSAWAVRPSKPQGYRESWACCGVNISLHIATVGVSWERTKLHQAEMQRQCLTSTLQTLEYFLQRQHGLNVFAQIFVTTTNV